MGVFRVSWVAVAVALIAIALIFAVYSYVNAARQQISSHVVSSVVDPANVSRLLSSLRIALISDNKTLVEDFADAFASVGISKMQSATESIFCQY